MIMTFISVDMVILVQNLPLLVALESTELPVDVVVRHGQYRLPLFRFWLHPRHPRHELFDCRFKFQSTPPITNHRYDEYERVEEVMSGEV